MFAGRRCDAVVPSCSRTHRRPDILAAGHTSRPMHQPAVTPTGGYINHRTHQPQKRGLPFGAVRVFACVARASASCVQDDVAPGTQVREPGTVQRWDAGARAGIGAALGCWCKTGGDAAFGTLAHEPGAAQCPGRRSMSRERCSALGRRCMSWKRCITWSAGTWDVLT